MHIIIIDGLDASGKSTQANLLAGFIRESGRKAYLRIHPSDCFFGKKTLEFLQLEGKSAHFCSAFFYLCDVWDCLHFWIFSKYLDTHKLFRDYLLMGA